MKRNLVVAIAVALVSLLLFWGPFLFKIKHFWGIAFNNNDMSTVVQNFDGLNFLVVAKSLYNPQVIDEINAHFLTGNEPIYFAAHYPLYPILIRIFSAAAPLPTALLLSIVFSNVLLAGGLYCFFAMMLKSPKLAVILSVISLFLPARMLSVRVVGSSEPLFIFFVLTSLVASLKHKDWLSGVLGALAVLTRSPGILLFGAYALAYFRTPSRLLPYLLMPAALLGLFGFYGYRYGSPLAYFQSGDNLHLFFQPFQIFSNTQSWITDIWREDIIYLYLFYGIGVSLIARKFGVIKLFGYTYGAVLLFVAHRDLARYALPLAPVALLGYGPLIAKIPSKFYYLFLIVLLPIFLLGWQFVLGNVQPINDWGIFL